MNIYLFFPYYHISGVPLLFKNIAEYFSLNYTNLDVIIVDYEDGYMAKHCKFSSNLRLEVFKNNIPMIINEGCIIMQAILPYGIRKELVIGRSVKIMFWSLFPDNYFPFFFPFVLFKRFTLTHFSYYKFLLNTVYRKQFLLIKRFIEISLRQKSLYFMDVANENRLKTIFGIDIVTNKCYLPITTNKTIIVHKFSNKNSGSSCIRVAWIGRVCDFKHSSLSFIIEKLSEAAINLNIKISLAIIGDGKYLERIKSHNFNNHLFDAIFLGTLSNSALNEYLIDNIDLNISMGTSALESAKLGIPTLLIDYCYSSFPKDYQFRWVFETIDYDLGHEISIKQLSKTATGCNLEKLLLDLLDNFSMYRRLCFDYYEKYHSIEKVCNQLIDIIKNNLPVFEIYEKKFFEKGLMRKTYEYFKYF